MQDLGGFMKGLLQRFSQWFKSVHSRTGTLWEDRFKSVIVENGVAARKLRGEGAAAGKTLWSLRDLRKGIA